MSRDSDMQERLKRIETKLIRGFEEMGISTEMDPEWLTVDDAARVIYVSTMGRSMSVIMRTARQRGATKTGKDYEIVHKGEQVGSLILQD